MNVFGFRSRDRNEEQCNQGQKHFKNVLENALYTPDGKWIAAYDYHNKLYIWNGKNYNLLFTADIDKNKDVADIGFTEDGSYAVIVYADGSALKLKLFTDTQDLIDYANNLISN